MEWLHYDDDNTSILTTNTDIEKQFDRRREWRTNMALVIH